MAQPNTRVRTELNVRSAPDPDDPTTLLPPPLKAGETITVLSNQGHWLVIRDDRRNRSGFVNGTFTECLADGTNTLWQTQVTASGLNIRSAPSPKADIRHMVRARTKLDVVGYEIVLREDTQKNDLWLQVRFSNQHGYVASKHTMGQPADLQGELQRLMAKDRLTATEVQRARTLIAEVPNASTRGDLYEALQTKTVYRSQRNNEARDAQGNKIETRSGKMCNLTSLAMCLDYLGIANPRPDQQFEDVLEQIRAKRNYAPRTHARGWSAVARDFGVQTKFLSDTPIRTGRDWYVKHVRSALRAGHPVMLSITGHIVRVVGINDQGIKVRDPAGKSQLGKGTAYRFLRTNKYGATGETVGKDIVWVWEHVEQHQMHWIAKFKQSDTPSGPLAALSTWAQGPDDPDVIPLPPMPDVEVEDDDTSHIDELAEDDGEA